MGFTASVVVRDLVMPDDSKARALAFLMGLWGAGGLVAFGPGGVRPPPPPSRPGSGSGRR